MQEITVIKSHSGGQLMDELIAAIPTFLRTTPKIEDGITRNFCTPDSGAVFSYPDGSMRVTFADDIESSEVQSVINVHIPI